MSLVTIYHGTCGEVADLIVREGLKRHPKVNGKPVRPAWQMPRSDTMVAEPMTIRARLPKPSSARPSEHLRSTATHAGGRRFKARRKRVAS